MEWKVERRQWLASDLGGCQLPLSIGKVPLTGKTDFSRDLW